MADNKLVGQNYVTPDIVAKVTGKAKYAEDFRAEGMLFAKILTSPMPHARVKSIDTSAALAMPGVKAILTEADLPGAATGAELGENVRASAQTERGLTMEPLYYGEAMSSRRPRRSRPSRLNTSRSRSWSTRSKACVQAARTRANWVTCGFGRRRMPLRLPVALRRVPRSRN
jgi:hypothetical protein